MRNFKEMKKMDIKKINPSKSPDFLPKPKPKPNKKMDFGEAMQAIVKGKKVTKEEWKDKKWFAFLNKEDASVALTDPDGQIHSWIISEGDIVGKDYFEI